MSFSLQEAKNFSANRCKSYFITHMHPLVPLFASIHRIWVPLQLSEIGNPTDLIEIKINPVEQDEIRSTSTVSAALCVVGKGHASCKVPPGMRFLFVRQKL